MSTLLCVTVLQSALLLSGVETAPAAEAAPTANAPKLAAPAPAQPAPVAAKAAAKQEAKPAPETYSAARRDTVKTGKPMVIMVSTDWCVPCQMMKRRILPRVREHGLLRKVAFARVNPDQDAELANQLIGGGPVPQLVMYCRTSKGWVRRVLVGGQSVETVEDFIKEGLALDKPEKKAAKEVKAEEKSSNRS